MELGIVNKLKFKLSTVLITILFFLSGCAFDISRYEVPVPSTVKLNSGDKVGVINFLRDSPTHVNIGRFVWGNFSKELNFDWGIRSLFQGKVLSALEWVGAEVVTFDEKLFDDEKVQEMAYAKDGEFHVKNPEQLAEFKNKYGLRALVVIGERDLGGLIFNSPANTEIKYYGIYTSSSRKGLNVQMINHYALDVFHFEPTVAVGLKKREVESTLWSETLKSSNVSNIVKIADLKNVNSDEVNELKNKMLEIAGKISDEWSEDLRLTFQ